MDRKSEIIKATLELASENGLAAVSMNLIAEKLGISKPALYKHFRSREEIIKTMYSFLRQQAKQNIAGGEMNWDMLSEKIPLEQILTQMVDGYRSLCTNPDMFRFYKIIMAQRTIDTAATEIMVMETKAMVDATKKLFYALQAKHIADFPATDSPSRLIASELTKIHGIFSCVACTLICISAKELWKEASEKILRLGIYLFVTMHWISAIGYSLFPLTGSGYDGSFQSFVHIYVITVLVVLLSIVSLILIAVGVFNRDFLWYIFVCRRCCRRKESHSRRGETAACIYLDVYKSRNFSFEGLQALL